MAAVAHAPSRAIPPLEYRWCQSASLSYATYRQLLLAGSVVPWSTIKRGSVQIVANATRGPGDSAPFNTDDSPR